MREKAPGSTSPQVGSAKVTAGSYGDVTPERGEQRADHRRADDARQATGNDRELDGRQGGHSTRLHVAEARASLDHRHLNGGHPAAKALGDGALEDGVAQ